MEKLEIIGTRFTICFSNKNDIASDLLQTTKGYRYKEILGYDLSSGNTTIYNDKNVSYNNNYYIWLLRESKIHQGKPSILSEDDFKAVLRLAGYYSTKIVNASNSKRKTYYYGVLESLLAFSGSSELLKDFRDSTVPMGTLRDRINKAITSSTKVPHGVSVKIKESYGRYSMTDLVSDLVADKAKLIMDDNIYAYNWQGRKSNGFGNIKPIIESTDLYPTYRITGIQGNQTNANLSIKFDFKANYDTGSAIKVLEVSRNLMVVQNGNCFQNMVALHVSDALKKKLDKLGLIDTTLPGPGDILIDLSKVSVSSRKYQRNRTTVDILVGAACTYHICKRELEKIEPMIKWTQEEITKASEKAQASKDFWALNKAARKSVASGKKIYSVQIVGSIPTIPTNLTQDQLRTYRNLLITAQNEAYNKMTALVFNLLVSKKTIREFLNLSKKTNVTKGMSFSREITSPMGLKYKCNFKFQ